MTLYEKLKRAYNILAMKFYILTSKCADVELSQLFDTPTMKKYHQILSALRYVAVEEYYGQNNFGREFYITANRWENDAALQADLDRFDALIKSIETKGYDMKSIIYVDRNNNCFNGTHRLALCAWFGIEKIPAYIVNRQLNQPTISEMQEYYRLSDEDFAKLEAAYERMYERIHNK